MAKVNYEQMMGRLIDRQSFDHGSAHAVRYATHYVVYSYNTFMLEYDLLKGEVTFFNPRKYSQTTSRLQKMLRFAFDVSAFEA